MEALLSSLYELYGLIRGPIVTPEANVRVMQETARFYDDPQALPVLAEMASRPGPGDFFRLQALIALHKVVGKYQSREVGFDAPALAQVLIGVMTSSSPVIRDNAAEVLDLLPDSSKRGLILTVANQAVSSGDVTLLTTALMSFRGLDLDNLQDAAAVAFTLIDSGLVIPAARREAVCLGTQLLSTLDNPGLAENGKLWNAILAMTMESLRADDIEMVEWLCQTIASECECESVIVNIEPIFRSFVPLVGGSEIGVEAQLHLLVAVNEILWRSDAVSWLEEDPSRIIELTEKYFAVSGMSFNPEDELPMSNVDVFEQMSDVFEESDTYVEHLFSRAPALYSDVRTRAGVIMAIAHVVPGRSDTLLGQLDVFVRMIITAVHDPIGMVRAAAAAAIREMAEHLEDEMGEYFTALGTAIIESIEGAASHEMLEALEKFLDVSETDPLFEPTYAYLVKKLGSSTPVWRQFLFSCLTALCCGSKTCVQNHFDEVLGMMLRVTTSQDTEEKLLIEGAIKCIAHLSGTCAEMFAPKALEFVQFLITMLQTEDVQLRIDVLQALWTVVEHQGAQLAPIVEPLVRGLVEIANHHAVSNPGEIAAAVHVLIETGGGEDDESDEEKKDESLGPAAIPSLVLAVVGEIAVAYPAVLPPNVQWIVAAIGSQCTNSDEDAVRLACGAMERFVEAAAKCGEAAVTEIGKCFVEHSLVLLGKTSDVNVAVACVDVLKRVVDHSDRTSLAASMDQLISLIGSALDGKLTCQKNRKGFIEDLHPSVECLMIALIRKLGEGALTSFTVFIPLLIQWCSNKKKEFREIGVMVLGELVGNVGSALPEDLLANIFQFAATGLQRDSRASAVCIGHFAGKASHVLRPHLESVLGICLTKLRAEVKRAVSHQEFIDNVVALVGEIQRAVMKEEFPMAHFLEPCLARMPARYDTDCNRDIYDLYVWMAEKTQAQPLMSFATAGVKLFAQADMSIGEQLPAKVARIVVSLLGQMENPTAFIQQCCEGDVLAISRVQKRIA